jgi:hypothetical protein
VDSLLFDHTMRDRPASAKEQEDEKRRKSEVKLSV